MIFFAIIFYTYELDQIIKGKATTNNPLIGTPSALLEKKLSRINVAIKLNTYPFLKQEYPNIFCATIKKG